ncbi:Proteoglycan 4 [Orchesella cincta]|uniref:Proteoglycan 4 n=1 Tax=Orchesella cincta TaxID=48709 RepID=A0A1D2NA65_ORCCI|nr:Proteoglycan 4 [Orchesella cincta]
MKTTCACGMCGLTINKGTRAFAVIEMFLVLMHVKHIYDAGSDVIFAIEFGISANFYLYHFFKGILCVCLILLSVFAFLLYFVGYAQKNVTVCWIWIGIAATTWLNCVILVLVVLIRDVPPIPMPTGSPMQAQVQDFVCGGRSHLFVAVYELYLVYGMWVVFNYIKWIQREGVLGAVVEDIVESITLAREEVFSMPVKDFVPNISMPDSQTAQPKQEPAPVVKQEQAPVVKQEQAPVVKQEPAPVVKPVQP